MYVSFRCSKVNGERGANGSIVEDVAGVRVYQRFVADDAALDALEARSMEGAEEGKALHLELYNVSGPPFEGFLVYLDRRIVGGRNSQQVALVAGDVFVMNEEGDTIQKYVIPTEGTIHGLNTKRTSIGTSEEAERLHLILDNADAFFCDNLWDEEDGRRGREKLVALGIPEEIWSEAGLGYALPKWNDLKNVLGHGCTIDDLIALGLVVEGSKKTYDRFRDRVILPLRDTNGRPIGFRGLAIDGAPNSIGSKIHDLFDSPAPTSFGVGDWAKPFYS